MDGVDRPRGGDTTATLADVLGVTLDADLLALALTHRSYAYENGGLPTNERLEFLGDSVLGLAVTELLYLRYADSPESDLARLRSSIVSTKALAALARTLGPRGLGPYVRLGRGETLTRGRDKDSILADTMEALVGAVFVQEGFDTARAVVVRLVGDQIHTAAERGAGWDWKTVLQEVAAARALGPVRYDVSESGPDHDKRFSATVAVAGAPLGTGTGRSKKSAEQLAAQRAHEAVTANGWPPVGTDGRA